MSTSTHARVATRSAASAGTASGLTRTACVQPAGRRTQRVLLTTSPLHRKSEYRLTSGQALSLVRNNKRNVYSFLRIL